MTWASVSLTDFTVTVYRIHVLSHIDDISTLCIFDDGKVTALRDTIPPNVTRRPSEFGVKEMEINWAWATERVKRPISIRYLGPSHGSDSAAPSRQPTRNQLALTYASLHKHFREETSKLA